MSQPVAALIVRVAADLSELKGSVGDITGTLGKAETSAKNAGRAILAAFSAAQVIGFAKDATASFAEEEAALQKLTTALIAQGNATPNVIEDFSRMAKVFQRTTTFSDELIVEMQALLVQVGNVAPGQMQMALTAATNLATGLGIDLRTATMLVGKAFEGETGTLKRYGIVIDDAKLKGEGITAVLDAINQKFGGQASAAVETHTGKMKQFANQIDEVKERVGNAIATVLSPLLTVFLDLPSAAQSVITILGGLVSAAAPVVVAFTGIGGAWKLITPYLGPVGIIASGIASWFVVFQNLDVFVWAAVTTWTTFKDRLSQTGTELVAVSKATYEGIKTWLLDKFTDVVNAIKSKVDAVSGFFKDMYEKVVGGSYVPEMINGIKAQFERLNDVMVGPAAAATAGVMDIFKAGAQGAVDTFQWFADLGLGQLSGDIERAFGPKAASAVAKFNQIMSDGMQAATGVMRVFAGDFTGLIDAVIGGWNFVKGIWSSIKGIFGGGSGRDMVESFAGGMGGFDALHAEMIAKLGDVDADRLWRQLTQTDKGGAQAAIDEIQRRLGGGIQASGGTPDIRDQFGNPVSFSTAGGGGLTITINNMMELDGHVVGRAVDNYQVDQYMNQHRVGFAT